MRDLLTEPCRPYDLWSGKDAVDIWAVIDRLTEWERRVLVMSYAMQAPAAFERKLLRIWAEREAAEREAAADRETS